MVAKAEVWPDQSQVPKSLPRAPRGWRAQALGPSSIAIPGALEEPVWGWNTGDQTQYLQGMTTSETAE